MQKQTFEPMTDLNESKVRKASQDKIISIDLENGYKINLRELKM